jgi:hypothetical protein
VSVEVRLEGAGREHRWGSEEGQRECAGADRRDDAVLGRVSLHDLELDGAHAAAHEEHVVLADGAVGLEEVRLEEDVEEVAAQALDRVVDGEDVHTLAVLDVRALVHGDHVAEADLWARARGGGWEVRRGCRPRG